MVTKMDKTITYDYIPGKAPENLYIDEKLISNMSDEELHKRALSDPDAQPLTKDQLKHFKRVNPNLPHKEA